nr:MAG TPA: hypothetical protein [Caudoviricetes sp.]
MSQSSFTENCEHINFNNDNFCSGFASLLSSIFPMTSRVTPNLFPNSSWESLKNFLINFTLSCVSILIHPFHLIVKISISLTKQLVNTKI